MEGRAYGYRKINILAVVGYVIVSSGVVIVVFKAEICPVGIGGVDVIDKMSIPRTFDLTVDRNSGIGFVNGIVYVTDLNACRE